MIRHVLGVMFSSFIGLVLFVNLYQFSGAPLPFDLAFTDGGMADYEHTMFGFSSIITFVQQIGTDGTIQVSLNGIKTAFSMIQEFSINDLVSTFVNIRGLASQGQGGLVVLYVLTSFFNLLKDVLVLPIVTFFAVAILFFSVLLFVWQLLTFLFMFMVGAYNVPLTHYGNIPNATMVTSALAFL